MATALSLFPARVRWSDANGFLTPEAVRALQDLFTRVGGANGASTNDLASADDDDSGLEEFKHETSKEFQALQLAPFADLSELGKSLDAIAMAPLAQAQVQIEHLTTELAGLRETVAELVKHIQGIEQGVQSGSYS